MPRVPRSSLPRAGFFHSICRANNHNLLFRSDNDFLGFIDRVIRFKRDWPFNIYHYSVMPTHVHFEVEVEDIKYLSKALHCIEISYYHYYNRVYQYDGHLWHSRFRSIPIESERYLFECGRYIELNAVVAEIVRYPGEYRWSSYKHYALGEEDPLVKVAPWYLGMGGTQQERQDAYKIFIYEGMREDIVEATKTFELTTLIGDVSLGNQHRTLAGRKKPLKNRAK